MAERGEIMKIHLTRGTTHKDGVRMDVVKTGRGVAFKPQLSVLDSVKEVWLWRLKDEGQPSSFESAHIGWESATSKWNDDADALRSASRSPDGLDLPSGRDQYGEPHEGASSRPRQPGTHDKAVVRRVHAQWPEVTRDGRIAERDRSRRGLDDNIHEFPKF